jgi:tetratricopeptide (TPR) repeat protein
LKHRAAVAASIGVAVVGLLVLEILSARQVQTWRDRIHVWENCVKVDPDHDFAHCRLADNLVRAGQFDRAFEEYKLGLRLDVENVEALSDLALMLATCDDIRRRNYPMAVLLAELACRCSQWEDPKVLRRFAVVHCAAADDLHRRGEFEQAIQHYGIAIDADADYDVPLFNLASLLATCSNARLRDPDRAVRLAERGCQVAGSPDAYRLGILATAYGEAGRFEEAVAATQKAIEAARTSGNANELERLRGYLRRFDNRSPPRASP